jgi:diketogulonate reductase-like aldo/keto reductase
MNRKKLGATDVLVPEIGFGTWQYSGGAEPLRVGIHQGAAFIDTAEIYGTEEIVGEAIKGHREKVFLATKIAPRHFRKDQVIAAAENSLRRLGTDYIDLYQLHWPNYTVPIQETMHAMEELVNAGKIRFIGVSNFDTWDLRKAQAALSRHKIVSNQIRYSLIDRTVERELLDYCQQNRITVIAYSPLGNRFADLKTADHLGVLRQVADRIGKTEAQAALNWVTWRDNVVAVVRASSVAHAVEDFAASGWRLTQSDYGILTTQIPFRSIQRGYMRALAVRWRNRVAQLRGSQL